MPRKILSRQKKIAFLLSVLVVASSQFSIPSASAAVGDLDTSFSGDGIVRTHLGSSYDYAESIALQRDGKIVTAGYFFNGNDYDFSLVRYNTDGTLDLTFSGDGKVTTSIGIVDDFATSVAIQGDGKIVVAGFSYNDAGTITSFALVRYNTDGTLDSTFSGDGKVTTTVGDTANRSYSIVIQGDGKIVVAGYSVTSGDYEFAIVRYNTDGTLDLTFSGDGIVTTNIGFSDDRPYSIALQSDGKIVAAGLSYDATGSNTEFALVRYNTDGTLDLTFSGDGKVTTSIGSSSVVESIAIQSDGKIVAAGFSFNAGTSLSYFALVRYNADGTLDLTFSGDGIVTTNIGSTGDSAISIAIQSDGKIVAAGISYIVDTGVDFTLVRYIASDSSLAAAAAAAAAAATAEAARVAAANAEAAKKAKEQKELTELLSVIPSIAGLALNLGDLTNSVLTTKCVKGKSIKYVKKGAKCPKGFVKKK
jgi:uncharacterized delta-60 repeat protein